MKPLRQKPLAVAIAAAIAALPFALRAAPQDGQVVAGNAVIRQETPTKIGITQTTDRAIIDWKSYSIGASEQVQYYQPSAASVSLNRVTGQDPSQILGRLTANGQVFLVNPNGIYFGKNAQIDVAGLVATTHNIRNEDFMAGRHTFDIPGKPGASVISEGMIRIADTGMAAFVAPSVANRGVIAAKLGKVVMAAANGFTLDFTGDNLLSFMVNDEVAQTAFDLEGNRLTSFVESSGKIEAQGGFVLLTAKAAENAVHGVINHSGVTEARTVEQKPGEIILHAGKGSLEVSGTLDASAPNGGDGGFIETSGQMVDIDDTTRITTAAANGKTGNWLIDPNNYTIAASGGDMRGSTLSTWLASSNATIQTSSMGTAGGNGDIFVNDAVSWSSGNTLTLQAERNVTINSSINASNQNSGVSVTAPGRLTVAGTGSVRAGSVRYSAGDVTLNGATTATGERLYLGAYGGRALRIESGSTSGVLSLTPFELSNLRATGSNGDLNLNSSHSITLATALTGAEIAARNFSLYTTGDITINAPIGNVPVGAPFLIQNLHAIAFGNLDVTANGSVGANMVSYRGDQINLVGRTTAGSGGVWVGPATASRALYVVNNSGSVPSYSGVELSRAELATLSAANTANINIGNSNHDQVFRGDLFFDASLDTNHIRSPNDLHFYGRDVYISSGGIDLSGGRSWLRISADRNIQFSAPVKAEGIYLTNGSGGRMHQLVNGTLTADQLLVTGVGGDLDDIPAGNSIGKVAANVTGTFWLNNGNRSLVVGSVDSIDGIRAGNIGLITDGTITLDSPLLATGTGAVSLGPTTTRDTLCTFGPCVRPHIELHAENGFVNNAGPNPLSVQPGKYWLVVADKRSTTRFNGWVVPDDAISYDGDTIRGDFLLSKNRFVYASREDEAEQPPKLEKIDLCTTSPAACEPPKANGGKVDDGPIFLAPGIVPGFGQININNTETKKLLGKVFDDVAKLPLFKESLDVNGRISVSKLSKAQTIELISRIDGIGGDGSNAYAKLLAGYDNSKTKDKLEKLSVEFNRENKKSLDEVDKAFRVTLMENIDLAITAGIAPITTYSDMLTFGGANLLRKLMTKTVISKNIVREIKIARNFGKLDKFGKASIDSVKVVEKIEYIKTVDLSEYTKMIKAINAFKSPGGQAVVVAIQSGIPLTKAAMDEISQDEAFGDVLKSSGVSLAGLAAGKYGDLASLAASWVTAVTITGAIELSKEDNRLVGELFKTSLEFVPYVGPWIAVVNKSNSVSEAQNKRLNSALQAHKKLNDTYSNNLQEIGDEGVRNKLQWLFNKAILPYDAGSGLFGPGRVGT